MLWKLPDASCDKLWHFQGNLACGSPKDSPSPPVSPQTTVRCQIPLKWSVSSNQLQFFFFFYKAPQCFLSWGCLEALRLSAAYLLAFTAAWRMRSCVSKAVARQLTATCVTLCTVPPSHNVSIFWVIFCCFVALFSPVLHVSSAAVQYNLLFPWSCAEPHWDKTNCTCVVSLIFFISMWVHV